MKILLCLCVLFTLLAGCTAQQIFSQPAGNATNPQQTLGQITLADLKAAIAIAQANGDTVAVNCYTQLQTLVTQISGTPTVGVAGVVSTFESARIATIQLQNGIPPAVHIACAPLVVDAQTTALRLAVLIKP